MQRRNGAGNNNNLRIHYLIAVGCSESADTAELDQTWGPCAHRLRYFSLLVSGATTRRPASCRRRRPLFGGPKSAGGRHNSAACQFGEGATGAAAAVAQ